MAKCDAPSWADEVEEEHQATGWTGLPVEDACESTLAAEEGGKKTKNGKKKKKRGKGVQAFDTAETRSQNSVPKDEGWVTASSRKPYHNSAPIRRVGQVPNSGVEGYAGNGQIARNTEQVPWRSSETSALERAKSFDVPRGSGFQNLNGGRLGRATDDDWDIANEQKDKGQILVQRVRKVELQSSQNEVLGGRQLGTDSFQSLNTTSPGYSSSQKDRPTQVVGKEMSLPVSSQKESAKNGGINTNIMMKLLPSEKGGEFEHMKSASPSTSHTKNEQVEFYPPPQLVLKDIPSPIHSDSVCSDDDLENDSDWIASDIYDSDASDKSLDTKKNNKWFRSFFETLDNLGNEQVMEHDRQWHCPVCQGGVGAIDWYRGLQPLLAHAKTMRTKRVKLHREFAKILEEDLETRRAGIGVFGETKFGKWKGLRGDDETTNPLIVWPPMVVIQNTQLELDEHDKWCLCLCTLARHSQKSEAFSACFLVSRSTQLLSHDPLLFCFFISSPDLLLLVNVCPSFLHEGSRPLRCSWIAAGKDLKPLDSSNRISKISNNIIINSSTITSSRIISNSHNISSNHNINKPQKRTTLGIVTPVTKIPPLEIMTVQTS